MTPRGMTPHAGGGGAMTPGSTVRDNLNINREEAFMEDQQSMKHQQMEMKSQLVAGLQNLPKPSNDFEIVVPEASSTFVLVFCLFFSLNLCYFLKILKKKQVALN